jgi:hypothetical protein
MNMNSNQKKKERKKSNTDRGWCHRAGQIREAAGLTLAG